MIFLNLVVVCSEFLTTPPGQGDISVPFFDCKNVGKSGAMPGVIGAAIRSRMGLKSDFAESAQQDGIKILVATGIEAEVDSWDSSAATR